MSEFYIPLSTLHLTLKQKQVLQQNNPTKPDLSLAGCIPPSTHKHFTLTFPIAASNSTWRLPSHLLQYASQ